MSLDFRLIFESVPGRYMVLTPELVIAGASDAYLRATRTKREEIVGRPVFDVFPDNPDALEADAQGKWGASFARVLRTGQTDVMAVQEHDIRQPPEEGDGFVQRF
jgi:PAS domain-containing protein